jgi:hypothetical protein
LPSLFVAPPCASIDWADKGSMLPNGVLVYFSFGEVSPKALRIKGIKMEVVFEMNSFFNMRYVLAEFSHEGLIYGL